MSTDSKFLAASFGSGDILVWRLPDGLLVRRLHHEGHAKRVYSLAFSSDSRSLVSGSEGGVAVIWDVQHGRTLLRLEGHRGTAVVIVMYAPHGTLIATTSDADGSVKIWDASTGACRYSFDVKETIYQVAFSTSGSHVYIDINNSCSIYETRTFMRTAELCHDGYKSSASRQGDRIVTASKDDQVKIWSATTGKELLTIDYPSKLSYPMAFSSDGTELVFADSLDPSASCQCFSVSTDGNLLAASFASGDVLVWRLPDGLLVQRLHHQGHAQPVRRLAFSPDSRSLVSGSEDGTAIVWDIRHGRALLRLEGHRGTVGKVVYAPHGALIATASSFDKSVKIWDASAGSCLHSFDVENDIYQVAFSPNNSRVYVDQGGPCLIYDTQTYTRIADLRHNDGDCESSVSRQGDRIATASTNDQVKIWSAVTGEELLTIDYPRKLSYPVAFSPDGSEVLAACDTDETAVTFDSRTGRLRRVYQLSGALQHMSYSPRGDYVVLGDGVRDLHVCDPKSGAFLAKFEGFNNDVFFPGGPRFLLTGQNFVVHFSDELSLLHDIRDVLRLR
ncbi:uncharacterized protein PHACADRAFT_112896 [Phanerochaete carnosa HHB-10118-sp]|uniref:Pyrrolo-quinoline quinone repeat domain-containing protein n=1 Tax=Phanerochaete carnosa (strain HHB-10118-sp) TaxID=650164 RepID=K5WHL1_PHACS|nr:uncharacterized protein PHACADRAFT_112896 [Phanerochaete carnosa HHB-10118-sp]EKM58800.1 hypothetical protein PHACADRAFT_112896 [Phanerochaete carnosa HHB-10118-sp]